jgi:hypothetical protein
MLVVMAVVVAVLLRTAGGDVMHRLGVTDVLVRTCRVEVDVDLGHAWLAVEDAVPHPLPQRVRLAERHLRVDAHVEQHV